MSRSLAIQPPPSLAFAAAPLAAWWLAGSLYFAHRYRWSPGELAAVAGLGVAAVLILRPPRWAP